MPKLYTPKLEPIDWLSGQFSLDRGMFKILGHDDAYLAYPEVVPQDPNPDEAPGSYEIAWSGILAGPVTITTGNYEFTGKVTDGYNKGSARIFCDGQNESTETWENYYWFTFSGDWSNGWHTLGEVQCVVQGSAEFLGSYKGTLTVATRTGLLLRKPRRPSKLSRKRVLASQ